MRPPVLDYRRPTEPPPPPADPEARREGLMFASLLFGPGVAFVLLTLMFIIVLLLVAG